jgi:hypothetical protein
VCAVKHAVLSHPKKQVLTLRVVFDGRRKTAGLKAQGERDDSARLLWNWEVSPGMRQEVPETTLRKKSSNSSGSSTSFST